MMEYYHAPIMLDEVLNLLKPERGGIFLDCTLGGGGHAEAVLNKLPQGSRLYGIDRDGDAIKASSERLACYKERFVPIRGNFFDMKELLRARGIARVDGVLMDLGVSSFQLDNAERGFSYNKSATLNMRMDDSSALSAYDVVNSYEREALYRIIRDYGEERYASRIANAIVREREKAPIETTLQLAGIIERAMPAAARREPQHPAKRTYQAIRIEVNGELDGLEQALRDAESMLNSGGVLAVIGFHSLEDRIIKHAMKSFEHPCTCDPRAPVCVCGKLPTSKVLTRKPITASQSELERNPRARSAKLRAAEKL